MIGPGTALQKQFGEEAEIVKTIICGDSYLNENVEEATKPNLFIAGPAFNSKRYGVAAGAVAKAIQKN